MQQLGRSPNVRVKKSRREAVSEVEEPELVLEEADKFLKNSFFHDHSVMDDPMRGMFWPDIIQYVIVKKK